MQEAADAFVHFHGRLVLFGEPDKSDQQGLVIGQCIVELLLVMAEGLAQLALDAVTINGMLEEFLGDADEQLKGFGTDSPLLGHKDHTYRKGHHGTAPTEERLYQRPADHAFLFAERETLNRTLLPVH